MGRDRDTAVITPENVEAYLRENGFPDAELLHLRRLGDSEHGLKSYGYGKPVRATFVSGGKEIDRVFRTMSADPFGHSRHSDRVANMVLSYDTFHLIPRHIHATDIGAFDEDHRLISMAKGEVFLVTDYVEGELYAGDLHNLQHRSTSSSQDIARAEALANYLAELHSIRADASAYRRHIRDTVGSGEGIFGQTESYWQHPRVATRDRLMAIEEQAVRWRWKLRELTERSCRTHGDFHPFNILFRDGTDFSVLDCSRGAAGEAADDVTCLSVNYIFFALAEHDDFCEPFVSLWERFWRTYLEASGDRAILEVVAPYFAWRVLVLASPVWYPGLADSTRERLLRFAERLLEGQHFSPDRAQELLR